MPPIEPATTAAAKKPPVNTDTAHPPVGDKVVAPPSDSATTAGKLQGSVEMLNAPENVTNLPPGKVNALAKEANQGINSDIKVPPNPKNPANLAAGEAKVTLSSDVEARKLEAQNRVKNTLATATENPNNPPAGTRTDVAPMSQAQKLQSIADMGNAKRLGIDTPPVAGSTEAKLATIGAQANAKRAGVDTAPAVGSTEARLSDIAALGNAKRAGVDTAPVAGSTEAKLATIGAQGNAKRLEVASAPGATEAKLAEIGAHANAKRTEVATAPGAVEAKLAEIGAHGDAKRLGVATAPGVTEAKLAEIGAHGNAKRTEVANNNNPPANPLRDTRSDGTPKPVKTVDQAPVLDANGKPRPATEVVKPSDSSKKSDTSVPLTAIEKREVRAEARAALVAEREAKRDAAANPTVVKENPTVTATQTRAEVIAAKKAERLAANADPTTDTTRVKKVDPVVTPTDTTRVRPRTEVPAVTTDVVKPVKPVVPADGADPGKRPGRQPLTDANGDPVQRPNRRVPDAVGDTTIPKLPKPERAPRAAEPGDAIPKVRPVVPATGDIPAVVARRGDRSELPAGDTLTGRRKAAGDVTATAPLDPRQQRFLAEIGKGNDPTKLQAFKENFEKLSPQNRNTLMNLDGKQQLDVIAKMSKPVDHALDGGKLPVGDLAKLTARQDLKIPGLDGADPANRKFLTDVTTRFNEMKLDGTNANMKVSDLLKGMDPQKVSALEKFLTTNSSLDAGKLTLGQVDGTKLTQLMKGNFDMGLATGKQLTPQEAMQNLTRQFTAGDGTNTLGTLGRTINDMGSQPGRLSELVAKSLDARSPLSGTGFDLNMMPGRMGDFTARLNPLQELNVRNMLENSSKLAMQLDSGFSRLDFSARGDLAGTAIGLSQIIGTTFGDGRGDFAVRGDMVRSHQGDATALVAEAAEASGGKSQEYIAKLPIDATTGLPYDPSTGKLLDPMTGRPVGDRVSEEKKSQSKRDDEDEMDEKEKKKQKKDSDQDADKAKQKAMLLILQAKKKREQEIREKQLKDEKQKKEDETRIKYICKDGDTIQSVALKQLRDSRVAPLIYQINKQVIATKIVNGEQVPLLHAGLVIWLPSPKEIKEFRSKLVSSAGASAPTAEKFASAEDELAARFGAGWAANKSQESAGGQPQEAQPMSDVERKLMEDAMAEAKRRRENIEKALGPIAGGTTRSARADGEHLTYQVRLGDTLRSVATKHPSIGDVNLWRLLAEVNDLTTDVDAKGQPKAGLARGGKIKIPTAVEIAEYRQKIGSMAGQPMSREQRVAKNCPKCGRMTVQSASLCPCGHEFGVDKETAAQTSGKDAGTIVLEAITEDVGKREGPRTEDLDSDSIQTTKVGPRTNDAAQPLESRESQERTKETAAYVEPEQIWATSKDFEPTCRLTKSALGWDTAEGKLIIHLQLRDDEQSEWFPIVEYEVYGSYSIRHTFVRQTRAKKTVKIDLPAAAAMELAQNDVLANWDNYKRKYLLA